MTVETDKLVDLVETGDLHGAMLLIVMAWGEKYHPNAESISIVASFGKGAGGIHYPIKPAASFARIAPPSFPPPESSAPPRRKVRSAQ
jgi:hypothetical protein